MTVTKLLSAVALSGSVGLLFAQPYTELVPNFSRTKSNVSVRKLSVPTRAALDYAAYSANPVRFDPTVYKPKAPAAKVGIADLTFGGYFSAACADIAQTPLTEEEKKQPLAWKPLENKLWELTKDKGWVEISAKIEGHKWADNQIMRPYQEIAAVYLHGTGATAELWARLEFQPWVKFLNGIVDKDKDGFPEVYGKLSLDKIGEAARTTAFDWIRGDYTAKALSREEIEDWANVLASYWYPTLNTDIERTEEPHFPRSTTEKDVVKAMKGLVVKDPVTVIRGDPFGKPIYNVFVVENLDRKPVEAAPAPEVAPAAGAAVPKAIDTSVSQNFRDNNARFEAELKPHGSYPEWAKKNAAFADGVKKFLAGLPAQQMGFKGKDDWVFFRKDLEFMTAGDLSAQAQPKNPLPHLVEFQNYLKGKGVNMLFVVCPNKSEVYFDKLPVPNVPQDATALVNPWSRKFLKDAQAAGVEVIDLLPVFLKAKADDAKSKEPVYQKQDTHWTNRGLQIAAELIAARVKQYAWYAAVSAEPVAYSVRDTVFQRQGDIVERLPEADRPSFPPLELQAQRVYNPDGTPYKAINAAAPLMLIGDSFTGVYESVDCKSAGVGSHLAAKTGVPVEIITSWGGGPEVREMLIKLANRRAEGLQNKRLVVYMMVARDLYNYSRDWASLETSQPPAAK